MDHIVYIPLNLKQAEMEVYFKANFNQAISMHLLYPVYANICCESRIYEEVYNVVIQKAAFFRKLTFVVLYKFKQTT